MLTKDEAKKLVEEIINRPDPSIPNFPELVILDEATIERAFGWVFFYQTREYVETEDIETILVGNAPYIINRNDGSLHETGTAYPIEHYIEMYERTGSPHGCADPNN